MSTSQDHIQLNRLKFSPSSHPDPTTHKLPLIHQSRSLITFHVIGFNERFLLHIPSRELTIQKLEEELTIKNVPPTFRILIEGRHLVNDSQLWASAAENDFIPLWLAPQILGGKGGFGNLLRSQRGGKKTTNFGSSRLLDGRRLRDVELQQRDLEAERLRAQHEEAERRRREEARAEREARDYRQHHARMNEQRQEILSSVASAVEAGISRALTTSPASIPAEQINESRVAALWDDMPSSNDSHSDEDSDDKHSTTSPETAPLLESNDNVTSLGSSPDAVIATAAAASAPTNNDDDSTASISLKRPLDDVPSTVIDLDAINSKEELLTFGLEGLKQALAVRNLKVGGTLQERVERLWAVRGLSPAEFDPSLLATNATKRRRK